MVDGKSLVALLTGDGEWDREDLYWYYPHYSPQAKQPGAAVRSGDYKLIEHYDPPRVELYNLAEDIGEKVDLASEMPDKAAELRKKIQVKQMNPQHRQLRRNVILKSERKQDYSLQSGSSSWSY